MGMSIQYRPPVVNAGSLMTVAKKAGERAGAGALLAASQPFVPVEHGDLRDSGHVTDDAPGAAVVYDAVSEDDGYAYGIRQHEDLALNHPNGGQAKFLEQPMHTAHAEVAAAAFAPIAAILK